MYLESEDNQDIMVDGLMGRRPVAIVNHGVGRRKLGDQLAMYCTVYDTMHS